MAFPHSFFCWLLLAASGMAATPLASSASLPSVAAEVKEEPEPGLETEKMPDALIRALALASLVEDEEFQSRLKADIVSFQLEQGWVEAARQVAQSISDYRRGMALGKVAAALAQRGERERAAELIEQALGQSSFPHPWQGEAIRAEVAIALHAAGEEEAADAVARKLTERDAVLRAAAGRAVVQARRGGDHAPFTFEPSKEAAPELLHLARGAIEIARMRLAAGEKATEEVAALCTQVEAIVRACKATAGEELLDAGILWRKIGNLKKSAEVLGLAIRHLPPGVEMQGWQAGYFARMVGLYAEAGEEERVNILLESGRKGIAPQHIFHRPPALCQLAEAQLVAGHPEEADKTWAEAVTVALSNPNPPGRFLGAAQVAFSLARAGRDVPEEISAQFDTLSPARPASASRKK